MRRIVSHGRIGRLLAGRVFAGRQGAALCAAQPGVRCCGRRAENVTPTPGTPPRDRRQAGGECRAACASRSARLDEDPADPDRSAEQVTRLKTAENLFAQQEAVDQQIKDLEGPAGRRCKKQLRSVSRRAAVREHAPIPLNIRFDRLVNEQAAEKSRIELARGPREGGEGGARRLRRTISTPARRSAPKCTGGGGRGARPAVRTPRTLAAAAEQARLKLAPWRPTP